MGGVSTSNSLCGDKMRGDATPFVTSPQLGYVTVDNYIFNIINVEHTL